MPKRGGQPHLLQMGRPALLVFAAKLVERGHRLGESPFGLDQPFGHVAVILLGRLQGVGGVAQLLLEVARPALMAASWRR